MLELLAEVDNRRVPADKIRISPLPLAEADDRLIPPLSDRSLKDVEVLSPARISILVSFEVVSKVNVPPDFSIRFPFPFPAPVDRVIIPL